MNGWGWDIVGMAGHVGFGIRLAERVMYDSVLGEWEKIRRQ